MDIEPSLEEKAYDKLCNFLNKYQIAKDYANFIFKNLIKNFYGNKNDYYDLLIITIDKLIFKIESFQLENNFNKKDYINILSSIFWHKNLSLSEVGSLEYQGHLFKEIIETLNLDFSFNTLRQILEILEDNFKNQYVKKYFEKYETRLINYENLIDIVNNDLKLKGFKSPYIDMAYDLKNNDDFKTKYKIYFEVYKNKPPYPVKWLWGNNQREIILHFLKKDLKKHSNNTVKNLN
ncbi:Uncharacterised protein [Mycoplasmopsis citelli]|uniref:Uncharacterized protein n=1 Tax=Mycoplasmopsis citelli TaxID=171281 RepID=A0A449B111_9BACT|nr:hypothetical protein [Mycoplasmopsis citelli]VEU74287.1 Uncharacterised protein [Mycoplasmopsis citelli]